MNSSRFAKALVLMAALAITVTPGCRKKPKGPITPLPTSSRTGGPIQNPPPGGVVDSGGTMSGDSGTVPHDTNLGLGGRLERSQYNENRTEFAANTVLFDFDSAVIKTSE